MSSADPDPANFVDRALLFRPYMVGETIPGYCGGNFSLDTMGQTLRVEAVGADWIVLRGPDDVVHFYVGSHGKLREDAAYERHKQEGE